MSGEQNREGVKETTRKEQRWDRGIHLLGNQVIQVEKAEQRVKESLGDYVRGQAVHDFLCQTKRRKQERREREKMRGIKHPKIVDKWLPPAWTRAPIDSAVVWNFLADA